MNKMRTGDLVKVVSIFSKENLTGVIVKGPYPAVFHDIVDGMNISEETLVVDFMCEGRLYLKVKCSLLERVDSIQPLENE